MKNPKLAVIVLTAFVLVSVTCLPVSADEVAGSPAGHLQYARYSPVAATEPMRVGPFSLSSETTAPSQTKPINRIPRLSLFGGVGDQLGKAISVFGERIVPPPEVSELVHVEESYARIASDKYRWTFWKYRNVSDRPLFGTDFLFTYQYPTEGSAPRDFRGGEVIVGFGVSVPLTSFTPLGRLFTSR
ncbi:MAG: hypothetical protein WCO79_00895 [bacterium]